MSKPTTEEELTYDQIISNRAKKIQGLARLLKHGRYIGDANKKIVSKIENNAEDILREIGA